MKFFNWDFRPAVIANREAWAMLKPGGDWTKVDYWDVHRTASIWPEALWREYFKDFGELNPPNPGQQELEAE